MAGFFPLLYHLQPPQGIAKIRYDRFSPYFNRQAQFGLQLVPSPCYAYIYPVEEERLMEIAYFFEDKTTRHLKKPIGRAPLHMLPGQRDVESCIHEWARGFWGMRGRPLLCTVDRQDCLCIIDTRPVAVTRTYSFHGLAAVVYRACSEAISQKALLTRIRTEQKDERITWQDLEGHLNGFIDNKLMLFLSDRYLALALDGNIPKLPEIDQFPGGYLDLAGFTCEYKATANFLGALI
jgi:magnesium-protoporphyrin IX monomethyl ester (oxidative) cyclase